MNRGKDAAFPALHIRPPSGWVNDPNGPLRWRGEYHVFFQHNPTAPTHGQICWGHAVSDDLMRWRYEPVALSPTPGSPDAAGCWSGCVVVDDGVATAVYTGVASGPETAVIVLAYARDEALRTWEKERRAVAAPPEGLDLVGFRDPFIVVVEGRRFAIVGAGESPGRRATVLVFACDDLREWTFLGPLLDHTDPVAAETAPADIWECPQLFQLDGRWVLVVSLVADGLTRVAWLAGDLMVGSSGPRFTPERGGLVDHGHDFYAPAVMTDGDRVLLWGWTWEDRLDEEVALGGWAGALTLTREVLLAADGRLTSRPASEIGGLHQAAGRAKLGPAAPVLALPEGPVDLLMSLRTRPGGRASVVLADALRLELDIGSAVASVHREVHVPDRRDWDTAGSFAASGDRLEVRVVLDGSVVEIFVTDGPTFTERLYRPNPWTLALEGDESVECEVDVRRLVAAPA